MTATRGFSVVLRGSGNGGKALPYRNLGLRSFKLPSRECSVQSQVPLLFVVPQGCTPPVSTDRLPHYRCHFTRSRLELDPAVQHVCRVVAARPDKRLATAAAHRIRARG